MLILQLSKEGLTTLLALQILGISCLTDSASSGPQRQQDKQAWLERLARDIVDRCWHPPDAAQQSMVRTGYIAGQQKYHDYEDYPYCCGKGKSYMSSIAFKQHIASYDEVDCKHTVSLT